MDLSKSKLKVSSDVWFVAFLMHNNVQIRTYEVFERGKVRCYFDLSDEQWQKYKLDFNESDLVKFKSLIQQIKDLSF